MLKRLKRLPWIELILIATLTNLIILMVEFILTWAIRDLSLIQLIFYFLYSGPLAILLTTAADVGMGVLAVYLFELAQWKSLLNASSLWALIFCLFVVVTLKSDFLIPILPFPVNQFVFISEMSLISIVIGVFWKGQPYWRYWR